MAFAQLLCAPVSDSRDCPWYDAIKLQPSPSFSVPFDSPLRGFFFQRWFSELIINWASCKFSSQRHQVVAPGSHAVEDIRVTEFADGLLIERVNSFHVISTISWNPGVSCSASQKKVAHYFSVFAVLIGPPWTPFSRTFISAYFIFISLFILWLLDFAIFRRPDSSFLHS